MTKRAISILAAILALAVTGCDNSSVASSPSASPAAPPAQPSAPAPATKTTEPGDILTVLSVEHQVDVPTQTDGVVAEITKDEGSSVRAGEIMARLDDRSIAAELEKAQADHRVAQNNVSYQDAEVKAKAANYRRQQQLRQYGLSSEADLEHAEFEAKGSEFDLASWKANLEKSQAEIRRLEAELDKSRIRAPFAGMVAHRYIRMGQGVSKSDKCFRISQLSPLLVQFQAPESAGRRPERGATVNLSLVGDSNHALTARIVNVGPTVDPASDSYNVTAQLTGSGLSDLRPGMSVRVDWPGAAHHKP
ncbi:MAG TPA: efflux RND transporter periplasmic adaptor subunit [Candidatus Limnocylindria bacterium]|nr:efflux RND transporter periplasmic adaptor subunit [Candidatus Limnocylindria bacterium]